MLQRGMILNGVYQIVEEIGQGGTGIIYLACHLRLQKRVIVKKVKDHFVGQVNGRAEADILKNLHHSYLPQVYDFLMIGDSIYTVMEYIEGRDLQYYLDQNASFSEELVRKWLLQLAEVLEYLHSQRPAILHSDIKPANIMITSSWDVCLIDFNISLDGETTKDVQGISPWYAAPEQYERAQHVLYGQEDHIVLDGRMDIYSLGATFYRVVTGRLPSPVEDQSSMLTYMEIPYSDALKAVIARMISPAPSRRFATAQKLRKALEDISRMDPVYRKLGCFQMGIVAAWIFCVIAGTLCIYYGNWKNITEKYQEAYQELYIDAEDGNAAEAIAEGTEILNSVTYRSYLEENAEKKANVLNIVGESYFSQEQYRDAASCYKEAWELDLSDSRYCENYLAALIRDGQLETAGHIAESAEGIRVLSQEKRNMIALEIAWMSGKTESAREELEELAENLVKENDTDAAASACLMLADIYAENRMYADAVDVLEKAASISPEKNIRRQTGETAYLAAMESGNEVYRNSYLRKALEHFEILNRSGSPSYEDRLNLALVQRAMGQYEDSNRTLKEMLRDYPEEYAISMWMCYNYLEIAEEEGNAQEIEGDLRLRYQDCKRYYRAGREVDEDMERLEEIMESMGE